MSAARISLLIPSYKRPTELLKTLESIWKTVRDPENIEIIVHLVNGDIESEQLMGSWVARVIRSDRIGFESLWETFNALAAVCTGDWIFMFCDDTTCHTYGWDEVIRKYDHTVPALLTPRETTYEAAKVALGPMEFRLYPILSRAAYEKLGCLTRSTYHDAWLHEVFEKAGIREESSIPVYFTDRIFGNSTLLQQKPEVQREFWESIDEAAAALRGAMQ